MATYTDIATRIRQYTQDNEAPLVAEVDPLLPWIVSRAEDRITRDLHFDAALVTARPIGLLEAGTVWVTKPPDWVANHRFWVANQISGAVSFLQFRSRSWLDRAFPDVTAVGEPRLYCNYDANTWRIAPSLASDCSAEITYEARVVGLSPSLAETWLSLNHPDLILKAALAECEIFHKSPANQQMYEGSYGIARDLAAREIQNQRADASNLQRIGI